MVRSRLLTFVALSVLCAILCSGHNRLAEAQEVISSSSDASLLTINPLTCFGKVEQSCIVFKENEIRDNCNSKFGGISHLLYPLEQLASSHIFRSYEYLMISTHFNNFERNRKGFAKLFMKLSDEKWSDAIDLIQYVSKRGGHFNFDSLDALAKEANVQYELSETSGLAKALEFEKLLAEKTNDIHKLATEIGGKKHDGGVMEYLQDMIEKFEKTNRDLAGYVMDLTRLASSAEDKGLAFYEFDRYLSSTY